MYESIDEQQEQLENSDAYEQDEYEEYKDECVDECVKELINN